MRRMILQRRLVPPAIAFAMVFALSLVTSSPVSSLPNPADEFDPYFQADKTVAGVGETVTFTNLTTGGTHDYTKAQWDFDGDGTDETVIEDPDETVVMQNVTWKYDTPGVYSPKLTMTDGTPTSWYAWRLYYIEVGEVTTLEVEVDIKPTSCPNPLNVKSKGVLPVAILGTSDFDVTQIDPASVRLEGVVAPLRWAIEDVAASYEGDDELCEACATSGPDGYYDLTLKFDKQEVAATLVEVSDGKCLDLELIGNLKAEFGGRAITGVDYVVILKKGK